MVTKVNVLIDGGFFSQKFYELNNKLPKYKDVITEVEKAMQLVKDKTNGETSDILFRIFYYDCRPFGGKVKDRTGNNEIDFSKSPTYEAKNHFLDKLCKEDKVAVRIGELSFDGWKTDRNNPNKWKPDFKQKGVDMKIGLDMALMATKKIVDKIVLIAGDSDFISPIKFVRKEGIQVYLYKMNHKVKGALIDHCDFVF